jgi:membrane-associated phospholipid phosphatase
LLKGIMSGIRSEEWLLAFGALVLLSLCLGTGTGFTTGSLLSFYSAHLAKHLVAIFLVSRLVVVLRSRWSPSSERGKRVHQWMGGSADKQTQLLQSDLELLRGAFLFLIALTVHTNVKVRLNGINPGAVDGMLATVDHWIFDDRVTFLMRHITATSKWLTSALDSIYQYTFVVFTLATFLFQMRQDARDTRVAYTGLSTLMVAGSCLSIIFPALGPLLNTPSIREPTSDSRYAASWKTPFTYRWSMLLRYYKKVSVPNAAEEVPFKAEPFYGIASFPSIPSATMALLSALSRANGHRWQSRLLWLCTALTAIAGISLGLEYGVDALGGFLLGLVVAYATPRLLDYWDAKPFLRRSPPS